ncbi:MAG: CcmD family protein [Gemmatimonadales bacterium]|nr:MAG: CcmD family protein [Gemmatimonadales bacterium]
MNPNPSSPMRLSPFTSQRRRLPLGPWVQGGLAGALIVLVAVLLLMPEALAAQGAGTAQARQMRHFWHVFAAYAIAWLLLFGWAVSIARRIRKVEEKLDRDP